MQNDQVSDKDTQQIISHNRRAWNRQVEIGCRWTVPVKGDEILHAKSNIPKIYLTSGKPVPEQWISDLKGKQVLLLAGGGGQQSALLSAYGAKVTVLDISDKQLEKDQEVAKEFGLELKTIQGSADDLKELEDGSFDYVINPVSNCFFPELKKVWNEVHRVLNDQGVFLYAFVNPLSYLFDFEKANKGEYQVKYSMPYSDVESLSEEERKRFLSNDDPLEFGHSFDTQLGDLLSTGFVMTGLFEDRDPELYDSAKYFNNYFNIRAEKR